MATITQDVLAGSSVIFLDSHLSQSYTGTIAAIRDHFRVDITVPALGRTLPNVPHVNLGGYVGWYTVDPTETLTHLVTSGQTYRAKKDK